MTEYIFRSTGGSHYEVTKLTDEGATDKVYKITYNQHNQVCNCPSWKQPCKHIGWIQTWLEEQGGQDGLVYDDQEDSWYESLFAGDELKDFMDKNC